MQSQENPNGCCGRSRARSPDVPDARHVPAFRIEDNGANLTNVALEILVQDAFETSIVPVAPLEDARELAFNLHSQSFRVNPDVVRDVEVPGKCTPVIPVERHRLGLWGRPGTTNLNKKAYKLLLDLSERERERERETSGPGRRATAATPGTTREGGAVIGGFLGPLPIEAALRL